MVVGGLLPWVMYYRGVTPPSIVYHPSGVLATESLRKLSPERTIHNRRGVKPPADIVVYLQSAFIKALSEESTTLDGANISVEADKYYVVPVGKKMGNSENTTVAGKIYNLGSAVRYVDLGVVLDDGTKVYFSSTVIPTGVKWSAKTEEERADWPTVDEWSALISQCYCVWSASPAGMYFFKVKSGSQSNNGIPANDFGDYSTESDQYIFLPASVGNEGYYWSSESSGGNRALCLYFDPHDVDPDCPFPRGNDMPGGVTVRRSS